MGVEKLALKYHVGKIKIKSLLLENGVEMKKRGGQKQNTVYVIDDWKIEKYPSKEGYHYIARFRGDGKEFNDYMNQAGLLTSYIKEKIGIDIPSLYDRRKYYMETGNYWWEQWFDIVKLENKPTKKCPYCNWETTDIENRSGAFEVHLREKHNISKEDYIKEYPEEKCYFILANETLNRQMCENEDEYVVCAICGKKLARINDRHLKSHGITRLEYIEKYNAPVYSKKHYEKLLVSSNKMNLALDGRNDIFTSKPEKEIMDFITNMGVKCIKNRKLLNGKEIDIFVEEKQIAIEFNGCKYHTEWYGGKSRQYHLTKTKMCKDKGVGLIHIFEDEFFGKKEIVFNKIQHILGIDTNKEKVYGRKCDIQRIDGETAKMFMEKFHIQGGDSSTVHYGAFCDDKLIAVMSFLRNQGNEWELTRFASDFNYICCGVGGKLFKYFIKEHNPNSVKSFADRRWTINEINNLYIQLGFKFDSYTPPSYTYYKPKVHRYQRFHKFGFRKKVLLRKHPYELTPEMTETEMVKKLGYDRIWDCGLIKYIWKKPEE
jgi:hypothetical protein